MWFKVDDSLPTHQRVIAAGNAAMGLWVRCGAWSMGQLTDGFIPAEVARMFGTPEETEALLRVGLWTEQEGGYQFHRWAEDGSGAPRQPTREQVEEKRKTDRERKAANLENARKAREGRRGVRADSAATPDGSRTEEPPESDELSHWPDPTRPDPTPLLSPTSKEEGAAPEPPLFCSKHPSGAKGKCGPCGDARRIYEQWERHQAAAPPEVAARVIHMPGLCDAHRQRADECEMCEREGIGRWAS